MPGSDTSLIIRAFLLAITLSWPAASSAQPANYRQVHVFAGGSDNDGALPVAGLTAVGDTLYGVTIFGNGRTRCQQLGEGCGTIYAISPTTGYRVVYSFKGSFLTATPDGAEPAAPLVAVDGALYGTTAYGGSANCDLGMGCGTVFRISPGGDETVLHSFSDADGAYPMSGLTRIGDMLYGTTSAGGADGYGTVFSIAPDGQEAVLHSFADGSDGAGPIGNLIVVDGVLYGVTGSGGVADRYCREGCGTVFAVTPSGDERVLTRFKGGAEGNFPEGGLVQLGTTLYGTTGSGGTSGYGTLFSLSLDGTITSSQSFDGSNGYRPVGSLVVLNGTLYGASEYGGSGTSSGCALYACGDLFSAVPGGPISGIYSFVGGSDGIGPMSGLTALGGVLFGTTEYGGDGNGCIGIQGCGTVFAIKP